MLARCIRDGGRIENRCRVALGTPLRIRIVVGLCGGGWSILLAWTDNWSNEWLQFLLVLVASMAMAWGVSR